MASAPIKPADGIREPEASHLSRARLTIFVLVFATIGGLILLVSRAASAPSAPTLSTAVAPTLGTAGQQGYINLSWAAPSTDGGSPITYYKIYRGTTAGGEATFPVDTVSSTWTNWTDDTVVPPHNSNCASTYYYEITALNVLGESVKSNELSVSPGNCGSVTNLIRTDNGTCGNNEQPGADMNVTSNSQPTFLVNGDGGAASYSLSIDNSTPLTFISNVGGGLYCYKAPSPLADGFYQITGNETAPKPANPVASLQFRIDTSVPPTPTSPVLPPFSKTGNPNGNYTKFTSPALTGSVDLSSYNTVLNGKPGVVINDANNKSLLGGSGLDDTNNYSASAANLTEGVHNITAKSTNEVGVNSPPSAVYSFTVDSIAPTISAISSPIAGATLSGTATITTNTADNIGGSGIWKVDLQVDDVTKSTSTTAPFSFNWDSTTVSSGNHSLGIIAYDNAGNTLASSTTNVVVQNSGTGSKVGDINGDGQVNGLDLSLLLTAWGTNNAASDLNRDGIVNGLDLSILLSHWGM